MKKVLIAAVALVMGASLSLAGMGITWSAGGGWMAEFGGDVDSGPGVAENNSVLWQLIYAGADGVANTPVAADLASAPYLAGDDELLASREVPVGGGASTSSDGKATEWDSWLMSISGDTVYEDLSWSTAGSVYQRIWQGTPSVEEGGKYFETDLATIDLSYATGSAAQSLYYDMEGAGVVVDKVVEGSGPSPSVPEPATMSLLGLGALAMVLRRKMSK